MVTIINLSTEDTGHCSSVCIVDSLGLVWLPRLTPVQIELFTQKHSLYFVSQWGVANGHLVCWKTASVGL